MAAPMYCPSIRPGSLAWCHDDTIGPWLRGGPWAGQERLALGPWAGQERLALMGNIGRLVWQQSGEPSTAGQVNQPRGKKWLSTEITQKNKARYISKFD